MATPLYKKLKNRGTSIYVFRSAANDLSLTLNNPTTYKLSFSKFVLLNFPKQSGSTTTWDDGTDYGTLFFRHKNSSTYNYPFQNFDPNGVPTLFSDQLVESLRNYIANYDTTLRESKMNQTTDFYNIKDVQTPTEFIFWKWARKLGLIDLEPALHKIDWDKNMPDFKNPNKPLQTSYDYFPQYLWKERDVNYYAVSSITASLNNYFEIRINEYSKFKVGDYIVFSGITSNTPATLIEGRGYKILSVDFTGGISTIEINLTWVAGTYASDYVYLKYTRFVQYIGEIQSQSITKSSKRNVTEITAQIPHHCGQTPNILFKSEATNNYYPDLEIPILPSEIQEYIVGAEYSNSPIRMKPQDYPGSAYGYFDTYDKTYLCSTGNKLTYSGEYYGILSSSIYINSKLATDDDFFETLDIFNSDDMDGICIDYDYDHYLKMNLPDQHLSNFDEFNSVTIDGVAPNDFEFNAILWYYDFDDGTGNVKQNLYGIEFLNNPNDDFDDLDTTYTLITPYQKLVSNSNQDGLSYIFNLNVNYDIDNGEMPMTYDPTTIYNQFGFDLYQNIMQANAQMYERFGDIINAFGYYQEQLFQIKSLVYSQTDIDSIKDRMNNLEELLQTYSTFQFQDSDTAKVSVSYLGNYPTLKFNVVQNEYADIYNLTSSEIYEYYFKTSGSSYLIKIPFTNKLFVNIKNDDIVGYTGNAGILFAGDIGYKQSIDIVIEPNMSATFHDINVNMNFNTNNTLSVVTLISGVTLPRDLTYYDASVPSNSTYDKSYYQNQNIKEYVSVNTGNTTKLYLDTYATPTFQADQWVYIDNLYFINTSGNTIDYSDLYQISAVTITSAVTSVNSLVLTGFSYYYTLNINTSYLSLQGTPVMSYYRGVKYNILRVDDTNLSNPQDRYKITKTLL